MKWSFQLARIAGIDVRVHATFLLLLAWFGLAYYADGGFGAMMVGLSFIILLFVCVVLHEFGHALAARAYGIGTPDITLLPFGGIARLERMPEKPWQEFVVALAGPAVNVVIAFALYVVIGHGFRLQDITAVEEGSGDLLRKLLAINIVLVVFNLMPAFPMDGGRVLRALLATRLKHARATRIAAGIGQAVAILFGLLGLFGNPMLLFIAVFVFFGAQQEALYATAKEQFDETSISAVMQPTGPLLAPRMTVNEAVALAMTGRAPVLPVVDASLRLFGTVPAEALADALRRDPGALIYPLVRRDFKALAASASLSEAVATARSTGQDAFPVINAGGQLVGMLWREQLSTLPGNAA